MNKKIAFITLLTTLLILYPSKNYGRNIIEKYEPEFWYNNMKYDHILIALKGHNISESTFKINYPNVKYNKLIRTNNPNISILDLTINPSVKVGKLPIYIFQKGRLQQTIYFEIKNKAINFGSDNLSNKDAIYQIIIDRFCNGSTSNDKIKSYIESPNRLDPSGVHGGDLLGVKNNLKYIKDLGFSAIELSPLYESNQLSHSFYHDKITSHFSLDKRLGSFSDLNLLTQALKLNRLKYIQSFILHKGSMYHWLLSPYTIDNVALETDDVTFNNYKNNLQLDPYATQRDITNQIISNHDFNDVFYNQNNQFIQSYLIQNMLWWIGTVKPDFVKIEEAHLNNLSFLQTLSKEINDNYPNVKIILDAKFADSDELSYCKSQLQTNNNLLIYDYPISEHLSDCFSEFTPSHKGVLDIQHQLGNDFIYKNTKNHIIFIDNPNSSRAFTIAEKNINQLKMLYTFILTNRSIPSILYGSEILLDGNILRGANIPKKDFPGGWKDDVTNAFTNQNLTNEQKSFNKFFNDLLEYRNSSDIILKGKTKHSIADEGIYLQHKTYNNKNIVIIYNNNKTISKVNITNIFSELKIYKSAISKPFNIEYNDIRLILLEGKTAVILELN